MVYSNQRMIYEWTLITESKLMLTHPINILLERISGYQTSKGDSVTETIGTSTQEPYE
jgi:hypothetical protein